MDRGYPSAVDFHSDGSLQQGDGKNQTIAPADIRNEAFQSGQRSSVDPDALSHLEKGMGRYAKARLHDSPDGGDLLLVNRRRYIADSNDAHDAWSF